MEKIRVILAFALGIGFLASSGFSQEKPKQDPTAPVTDPAPKEKPQEKKEEKPFPIFDRGFKSSGTYHPAPGNTGSNAFRNYLGPIDDPTINDRILLDFTFDYSQRNSEDHTISEGFSVEVPFPIWSDEESWASLRISNQAEQWKVGPTTQARLGIPDSSGSELGDINVSTKLRILDETETRPAISLRVGIKTANGDDTNKRYTNTAGYAFTALAAKNVYEDLDSFMKKVRIIGNLGFAAWDDSANTQNDVVLYGLAMQCELPDDFYTAFSLEGSVGWRENDKPMSAGLELGHWFSDSTVCYVSGHAGLTDDADDFGFLVGMRYLFGRRSSY